MLEVTDELTAWLLVPRTVEKQNDAVYPFWFNQNLFVHRNNKLNKQQVQETQKQYAYSSVTDK